MARTIPRFEASPEMFPAAVKGDPKQPEPASDGQAPAPTAAPGLTRGIRVERLEAYDYAAILPGQMDETPPDQLQDLGAPQPAGQDQDQPDSPTAEDLQDALSDAVEAPPEWTHLALLAGGNALAHCIRELLTALDWNGTPRQIAEILPNSNEPITLDELRAVFGRLGFESTVTNAGVRDVSRHDLPALYLTGQGGAFVLTGMTGGGVSGFDGERRLLTPINPAMPRGKLVRFFAVDASASPVAETTPVMKPAAGKTVLTHVWGCLAGSRPAFAAAAILRGLFALFPAVLLLVMLDHAVPAGSTPQVLFYLGLLIAAVLMDAVFSRLAAHVAIRKLARAAISHGQRVMQQTLMLRPSAISGTTSSAREARYVSMTQPMQSSVFNAAKGLSDLFAGIVFLGFAAVIGQWFAGAALFAAILMVLAGELLIAGLHGRWVRLGQHHFKMRGILHRYGGMLPEARWAGCFDEFRSRAFSLLGASENSERQAIDAEAAIRFAMSCLQAGGIAGGVLFGAFLHARNLLTSGELAACLFLTWAVLSWIKSFYVSGSHLGAVIAALNDEAVLGARAKESQLAMPIRPARRLRGHVDVSGLYTTGTSGVEAALEDVALHAAPGEVIVLAGDYRSGNSAVLQVLAGLRPPAGGQVRLDGIELSGFDPGQLRQSVTYVSETPVFLDATIAQNLRLSNPLATDGDLHDACARAGVLDTVQSLEINDAQGRQFGFDVEVHKVPRAHYMNLLKGLALARGYVAATNVLLLDNPDRFLTPDGLSHLMQSVEALREDKTIIIATDKPSLIRLADKVVWLDDGRVRASGPSDEVLEDLYNSGYVGQSMEAS